MQYVAPEIFLTFNADMDSKSDFESIETKYQIRPMLHDIVYLTQKEYDEQQRYQNDDSIDLMAILNGYV